MNLISIPREALAELLRAAGSPLTPEQYVASLPEATTFKKYPSRARAAAWSRPVLLIATVLSALFAVFSFSVENLILLIGLAAVTFFEYRVYRYFTEQNPNAPGLGFRNQSAFAAAILIYGLYHAFAPSQVQIPAEYRDMLDPGTATAIQAFERVFYLIIGIAGGVSQFALACYYRAAR
jgi:uncharacterized membrane protein YuzA (DUF378 family)